MRSCHNIKKVDLLKQVTILYIILIGISFGFDWKAATYEKGYIVAIVYFVIALLLCRGNFCYLRCIEFCIPLCYLGVWIYGLILGIVYQNNLLFVIRNFVGISIYISFYFIYSSKLNLYLVKRILLQISCFVSLLTIIAYIDMFIIQTSLFRKIPILKDFQQAHTILYASKELIYICYLYALYMIIFNKKIRLKYIALIMIDWIAVLFCIRSGGDLLAMFILTLIMLVVGLRRIFDLKSFQILMIVGSVVTLFLCTTPQSPLFQLFSPEDYGNSVRYEQIAYFMKELNIVGHGLGATFGGEIGHDYGVETIYINLFHKFGILAIVFILGYVYTVLQAIKLLWTSNGDAYDVIPLACMGYLIPSLANPMLFAPPHVLIHCIALLIIIERKKKDYNETSVDRNELL